MTSRYLPSLLLGLMTVGTAVAGPVGAYLWSRNIEPPQRLERLLPDRTTVPQTVNSRLKEFGAAARDRLANDFLTAGLPYPPEEVVLVGLKEERLLEIYGRAPDGAVRFIKTYPFAAWTGTLGPKLREGDRQIPEGVYGIDYLNPNSVAHVSLRIGYPNRFERDRGLEDGREDLGGDIMIHGKTGGSQGCIVLEDIEMEEIFTLAADTGIGNIRVLLAPTDLRRHPAPTPKGAPAWMHVVYTDLIRAMADIPLPGIQVAED